MTETASYLNPIDGVPQGMTDVLNTVIEAYLNGSLRGLGIAAFVAVPTPDGTMAIMPIARLHANSPLLTDGVLGELRRLTWQTDGSELSNRAQMVAAERAAEQRSRKSPILDANGAPVV